MDRISTARCVVYWTQLHHSPQVANAIACGALIASVDAIALAQRIGLLAAIDTVEIATEIRQIVT